VRRRTLTGIDVIDPAHRISVHGVDAKKPRRGTASLLQNGPLKFVKKPTEETGTAYDRIGRIDRMKTSLLLVFNPVNPVILSVVVAVVVAALVVEGSASSPT